MNRELLVAPDQCTSCRLCELVCSARSVGVYRPSRAHIRVRIDAEAAFYFPMICLQCEDAACAEACPTEALRRNADTGAIVVDADLCTECGECETACPYGAIHVRDGQAHKCDLCGGDPECVQFCSTAALRFEPRSAWPPADREAYMSKLRTCAAEVSS